MFLFFLSNFACGDFLLFNFVHFFWSSTCNVIQIFFLLNLCNIISSKTWKPAQLMFTCILPLHVRNYFYHFASFNIIPHIIETTHFFEIEFRNHSILSCQGSETIITVPFHLTWWGKDIKCENWILDRRLVSWKWQIMAQGRLAAYMNEEV